MLNKTTNYWFTPNYFHQQANRFAKYRWRMLLWSGLSFVLYILLDSQTLAATPNTLIWLSLFILFMALQTLVLGSFIFFFLNLPSKQATNKFWLTFYRIIEWCETILFTFLLPLPLFTFFYAFYRAWWL